MTGTIRSAIASAISGCLAITACVVFSSVHAAADSRWRADHFPNVTLTTQDGVRVHFYDDLIKGKIVAINLIYTTCRYACPLETARLAQVQTLLGDRLGHDVFFYSITIDPEHDTPSVLKEYAEKYHAGPGWLFLTGKQEDIDLLSKKLGLYSPPNPSNPDGHTPSLLVGNETTGQWMRNSALGNPRFLATTIGDWLTSWRNVSNKAAPSYAAAPRLTLVRGQYTFGRRCSACHTIGGGEGLGPDLLSVTSTRDRSWLTRFIVAPDRMSAAGDSIAVGLRTKYKQVRMPNLGLSEDDAAALIDYIDEQSRLAIHADTAPVRSTPAASGVDLRPIVNAYLGIQQALHADTRDGIDDYARRVVSEAAQLGSRGNAIRSTAGTFEQAADLPAARIALAALTDAILTVAQETGVRFGDDVKLAYCPMARKHWLQKGERLENPYYGKTMSECGRIATEMPVVMK